MNDDTAETIDSTNRSAGMPTVRPRGKRSRNSTASSRAESEFAAAVDLALQEYRSVILEAAKAGHPPIAQIESVVVALLNGASATKLRPNRLADVVSERIETILRAHSYVPVRAEPFELGSNRIATFKVYFVRHAELDLFEVVDRGEPVALAMTTDARRFSRALIDRYLVGAEDHLHRRVFLWTIASGLFELIALEGRLSYSPAGAIDLYSPSVELRRASEECSRRGCERAEVIIEAMGNSSAVGRLNGGDHSSITYFKQVSDVDSLQPRYEIMLDDFDGDEPLNIDPLEIEAMRVHFEMEVRKELSEQDRWPRVGKDGEPGDRMSMPNLLDFIMQRQTERALFVIYDAEVFLDQNVHGQTQANITGAFLRDVGVRLRRGAKRTQVVVLSAPTSIPSSLTGEVVHLDLPLPCRLELLSEIRRRTANWLPDSGAQGKAHPLQATDDMLNLVDAAAGMTLSDLVRAIRTTATKRDVDATYSMVADAITKAKRAAIRKSAALELVDREPPRQLRLGAMEKFEQWLRVRHRVFRHPELAEQVGINQRPKGVLILGIPGTGKSLAAKIIAREWQVPLVRLDMGAVQNRWVGASEERIREALTIVQAMSPCVLWIDEIDKGIAQNEVGHTSSVDQNVRATLLTWLQENEAPVFVVATANRFANLPPELTRAGRFDARFFFGCPGADGREEILRIHLGLRRYALVSDEEIQKIAKHMVGFTGAEIEQAVLDGLYLSFAQDRPPVADDFLSAASQVKPLIRAVGKGLDELWALIEQGRVELASEKFLSRADVARLIDPESFSPMYCRLESIGGWGRHAERAARILMRDQLALPAAVVLKTGDPQWAYVQTNMRMEPADAAPFKFLDRLETMESNGIFDTLIVQFGIEKVWFEDEEIHAEVLKRSGLASYSELFEVLPNIY